MDIQVVALIGLILAVLIVGIRTQRRAWPGSPGWQYFDAGRLLGSTRTAARDALDGDAT